MSPYKNLELELENILGTVVESGASDLHMIPGHPPIVRIDSKLAPMENKEILSTDIINKMAVIMMGQERFSELEKRRDLDFSYAFKDDSRFRVNAYYQKGNLAVALRFIPKSIRTMEELNLPPIIRHFTEIKQGLVLIVGPTGHGKSTTLAAMVDHINQSRAEHIITVEDPIEYTFTSKKSFIQQREVGHDTSTFAQAIRATLREDANVVMVGEMRDLESISATITVAETGHLVFATLHTNDAAQTIDRIIDSFPGHQQQQIRSQLAVILEGIISLRLVNKVGGGRVPAAEVLIVNEAARNLIRENKTYEMINVIHTGAASGMVSLDQSLAGLVTKNIVALDDAKQYVQYSDIFESRLRGGGSSGFLNNNNQ